MTHDRFQYTRSGSLFSQTPLLSPIAKLFEFIAVTICKPLKPVISHNSVSNTIYQYIVHSLVNILWGLTIIFCGYLAISGLTFIYAPTFSIVSSGFTSIITFIPMSLLFSITFFFLYSSVVIGVSPYQREKGHLKNNARSVSNPRKEMLYKSLFLSITTGIALYLIQSHAIVFLITLSLTWVLSRTVIRTIRDDLNDPSISYYPAEKWIIVTRGLIYTSLISFFVTGVNILSISLLGGSIIGIGLYSKYRTNLLDSNVKYSMNDYYNKRTSRSAQNLLHSFMNSYHNNVETDSTQESITPTSEISEQDLNENLLENVVWAFEEYREGVEHYMEEDMKHIDTNEVYTYTYQDIRDLRDGVEDFKQRHDTIPPRVNKNVNRFLQVLNTTLDAWETSENE